MGSPTPVMTSGSGELGYEPAAMASGLTAIDEATGEIRNLLSTIQFEVDTLGLDKVDRAVLRALCVTFAGQPVGLRTLAVAVAEQPETVEEVYEPFLLKAGLLQRTPRGRIATPGAYVHLGTAPPPVVVPPNLFDAECSPGPVAE